MAPIPGPVQASSPSTAAFMPAAKAWSSGPRATSFRSPTGRSVAATTAGSRGAIQTVPDELGPENFMPYSLSTDMQEEEIIFGGEKKLKQAIEEALRALQAPGDRHLLHLPGRTDRRRHSFGRPRDGGEVPDINVFGFSCEGYKGVSQSAGHHIANNKVFSARRRPVRAARRGRIPFQHARRVQYRRRLVRHRRGLQTLRVHAGSDLQRQRRTTTTLASAHRPTSTWSVLSVDQLHGPDDGDGMASPG